MIDYEIKDKNKTLILCITFIHIQLDFSIYDIWCQLEKDTMCKVNI